VKKKPVRKTKMPTKFQWKLEGKYHFGNLDVDGRIIRN